MALRILLVGNSFTWGIKDPLLGLISSSGRSATINVRAIATYSLAQHLTSSNTMGAIKDGHYDRVVLQEQSNGCYSSSSYPAIRSLNTVIRASGAVPVMSMTWRDEGQAASTYDDLKVGTSPARGYVPIATEIGAAVAPAGWMFRTAVVENSGIDLWNPDGHHANARGTYFAAQAIYCAIYGVSPVGLRAPASLASVKAHDQALANTVALADRSVWNIPVAQP